MVATAEAEDGGELNTIQFARKKARHSAFYKQPSKNAADQPKGVESTVKLSEAWCERRTVGSRRSHGTRCSN